MGGAPVPVTPSVYRRRGEAYSGENPSARTGERSVPHIGRHPVGDYTYR